MGKSAFESIELMALPIRLTVDKFGGPDRSALKEKVASVRQLVALVGDREA